MNKNQLNNIASLKIIIKGLVQGVGFRPFIYRIANENKIKGWVLNTSNSVEIRAEGNKTDINSFINSIKRDAPKNSKIERIFICKENFKNLSYFKILKSKKILNKNTEISPDLAVCEECIQDMKIQENRINYPFISCINCGPRFSIVKDIPYDRENTTMNNFKMCKVCTKEYSNVKDRRFHVQPNACINCGPEYNLIISTKSTSNNEKIINKTVDMLDSGKILSIKGIGGYNLVCDAFNKRAINKLRKIKRRDKKAFAVMFYDINILKKYAYVNIKEEEVLLSPKSPIVILKSKNKLHSNITNGLDTIGAMLPYMPFHYLLFERLKTKVLIYTSGNISNEPIVINDKKAKEIFINLTDGILIYNREIYNRLDDSIVTVVNNRERLIRRSRGYVPESIKLKNNVDSIIACGAELKNTFCIGKDNLAYISQHIGDLKNIDTYDFYIESIEKFKKLFKVKPKLFVCDMHPDYLSSKYAQDNDKVIMVQHHHAHIASCMAENNLDEDVIGIALDGIGYGNDGNIWGGEFFVCNLSDYKRYTHFEYIPIPGGDKATEEPWRIAVSYLYKVYQDKFEKLKIPFLKNIDKNKIVLIKHAIKNKINCPLTSSTGRFFDCISALLELCYNSSYEAEAPMKLEAIIKDNIKAHYNVLIKDTIKINDIIKGVVSDILQGINKGDISAKFHNSIIYIIIEVVKKIRKQFNLNKVVLSGGIFQNKYILGETEKQLKNNYFRVYSHSKVPSNDGGISLGQLAIAAKRRENKCV